jgi:hypothetical protein
VVRRRERKAAPLAPHWWNHLCWAFDARLDKGARAYGDESFERPLLDLQTEVLEELVDAVGWLFVLWCQVRRFKGATILRRKRFLEAVRVRLQVGQWTAPEPMPQREIERLATLAACQWAAMRQSLEHLRSAAFAIEAAECAAKHKTTARAGDAYIGRRGGLSE